MMVSLCASWGCHFLERTDEKGLPDVPSRAYGVLNSPVDLELRRLLMLQKPGKVFHGCGLGEAPRKAGKPFDIRAKQSSRKPVVAYLRQGIA